VGKSSVAGGEDTQEATQGEQDAEERKANIKKYSVDQEFIDKAFDMGKTAGAGERQARLVLRPWRVGWQW
jgi:hypothetical protein